MAWITLLRQNLVLYDWRERPARCHSECTCEVTLVHTSEGLAKLAGCQRCCPGVQMRATCVRGKYNPPQLVIEVDVA